MMRPHRARLSSDMLEMLVYLKCNLQFLEKLKFAVQFIVGVLDLF